MQVSGFITAGGRSSRMGRDKAWLELGYQSLIERAIAALSPVVSSLTIIANDDAYQRLGLPVLVDTHREAGPLEAIRTALANCPTAHAVLVGCDLPFVTTEFFAFLQSHCADETAVIPINQEGQIEPLCAVYPATALAAVTHLIARRKFKVSHLCEHMPTRFLPFADFRHLHGSELFFENINTPEDYARAQRRVADIEPGKNAELPS